MADRVYEHLRFVGNYEFPVDDRATLMSQFPIIEPTPGSTLVRTRLFLQFRVLNYPTTGDVVLDTQWWQNMAPYYGLVVDDSSDVPEAVGDPIGSASDYPWVIWGMGIGRWDGTGPDQDFPTDQYVTYTWTASDEVNESHAQRKTTVGNHPSMWLCWNWFDRHFWINQAGGSYPIAYDLAVNIGVDTLWELPPS